jgi:hypothetical protein
MELQQFIEQTLVRIAKGIAGANKSLKEDSSLKDSGAVVSPAHIANVGLRPGAFGDKFERDCEPIVHLIQFDVAVTATSGTATSGGVGVKLAVVDLGTKGQSDRKDTNESRIKFGIPMVFPSV